MTSGKGDNASNNKENLISVLNYFEDDSIKRLLQKKLRNQLLLEKAENYAYAIRILIFYSPKYKQSSTLLDFWSSNIKGTKQSD